MLLMSGLVQLGSSKPGEVVGAARPLERSHAVLWLQAITLAWMLIECGLSLFAAVRARSPVLFAFGADSVVELLSAMVVLLQFLPKFPISRQRAHRAAGLLLFALAAVVAIVAGLGLMLRQRPEASPLGIGVALAALVAMPLLAWLKRRQAVRDQNPALAADAVQSATCAYLAAVTLAGLGANALFHIQWFDPLAALIALPLLIKEGIAAWHGASCACC
jgi:divalent metal cation (Fe/Co/Zn/Cd) transporter